jgi:hypothetical protein
MVQGKRVTAKRGAGLCCPPGSSAAWERQGRGRRSAKMTQLGRHIWPPSCRNVARSGRVNTGPALLLEPRFTTALIEATRRVSRTMSPLTRRECAVVCAARRVHRAYPARRPPIFTAILPEQLRSTLAAEGASNCWGGAVFSKQVCASKQPQVSLRDTAMCCKSCSMCLAAHRAVAMRRASQFRAQLILYAPAEATPSMPRFGHLLSAPSTQFQSVEHRKVPPPVISASVGKPSPYTPKN